MSNRSIARAGASTGILFAVLSMIAGFIYPQQPRIDSSASTTLAWFKDNRVSLQVGMILGLFAAGALLWFVGYLRTAFTNEKDSLAPVVFGAGIAAAAFAALAVLPLALPAFMVAQPAGIPDPSLVRMFADLNVVLYAVASVVNGVFLLALGLAVLRRSLPLPNWLGWLSIVAAACNAVVVCIGMTFSSYHGAVWTAVMFSAFIGLLLVVLITSISLMRQPLAEPDLQSTP